MCIGTCLFLVSLVLGVLIEYLITNHSYAAALQRTKYKYVRENVLK